MIIFSEFEKEDQKEIMARARRGAKLLDQKKPGWVNKIRVTKLDMHDCEKCVLGQLYGDFHDGCNTLNVNHHREDGETGEWAWATHGFDVYDADNLYEEYAALGDAWKEIIKARKAKAKIKK